ncbi:MAG: glycosyltransferase family 1 protein, partial [Actinomycetota bacterium]
AGGAAVLVDPFDVADIRRGVDDALGRRLELAEVGRTRAAALTWSATADATAAVYRELCR